MAQVWHFKIFLQLVIGRKYTIISHPLTIATLGSAAADSERRYRLVLFDI